MVFRPVKLPKSFHVVPFHVGSSNGSIERLPHFPVRRKRQIKNLGHFEGTLHHHQFTVLQLPIWGISQIPRFWPYPVRGMWSWALYVEMFFRKHLQFQLGKIIRNELDPLFNETKTKEVRRSVKFAEKIHKIDLFDDGVQGLVEESSPLRDRSESHSNSDRM